MAPFKVSALKVLLLSLCGSTLATPVLQPDEPAELVETGLIKRRLGDENDPIDAEFNTAGWPLSAEFNCYIMLCVLNKRVL